MDIVHEIPEIAIVDYDGAQVAAVLGMTDLLTAGESMARQGEKVSLLRISRWTRQFGHAVPERVFDTHPDRSGGCPTIIVIPPGSEIPCLKQRRSFTLNGAGRSIPRARSCARSARERFC